MGDPCGDIANLCTAPSAVAMPDELARCLMEEHAEALEDPSLVVRTNAYALAMLTYWCCRSGASLRSGRQERDVDPRRDATRRGDSRRSVSEPPRRSIGAKSGGNRSDALPLEARSSRNSVWHTVRIQTARASRPTSRAPRDSIRAPKRGAVGGRVESSRCPDKNRSRVYRARDAIWPGSGRTGTPLTGAHCSRSSCEVPGF